MAIQWYKVYDYSFHGEDPQEINSVRTIDVGGELVCLARTEKGYFAVADKCPHANGRLGLGTCDMQGNIVCPVHKYRYNAENGKGLQGDFVKTYPVKHDQKGISIGIDDEKPWWKFW